MRSIFLTLSAAVCCSLLAAAEDGPANYSLWPRRPAELEQARRLMSEGKKSEAAYLLRPYWTAPGIVGREARQLTSLINVPRYLSRQHPRAYLYTIKRGDSLPRIARNTKCLQELLMLLNGLVEPSRLMAGQKLVAVPVTQRVEIHLAHREVSVWDGDILVADYVIEEVNGVKIAGQNEVTTLKSCDSYVDGARVRSVGSGLAATDRALVLASGCVLSAGEGGRAVLRMNQRDLNEMALLLAPGAEVCLVRDEEAYARERQAAREASAPAQRAAEAGEGEEAPAS